MGRLRVLALFAFVVILVPRPLLGAEVEHFVFGLGSDQSAHAEQNGTGIFDGRTSAAGALTFSSQGGGMFEVVAADSIDVPACADLVIVSQEHDPVVIGCSEPIRVRATVANDGPFASTPSEVAFYLDGDSQPVATVSIPALDPGTSTVSPWGDLGVLEPGRHFIVACADPAGTVPETDEANNCSTAEGN